MKTNLFLFALLLLMSLFTPAVAQQPIATSSEAVTRVSLTLRNPSILPRKLTLISYQPGQAGNGTNGFMLGPKGSKSFTFPAGTKLYLADSEQVDIVMSGKRIDSGKPFLTVTTGDANKSFDVK